MGIVRKQRGDQTKGRTDWAAIDALSDEEIERRALADPDAQPLTPERLARMQRVPQVRVLRINLGMTQEEFASAYGLSLATLRDWEQSRSEPDQSSRTLLRLISLLPGPVREALASDRKSPSTRK